MPVKAVRGSSFGVIGVDMGISSIHVQTAVDVDDLAGDETGKWRAQKYDGMRNLFRLAKTADRYPAQCLLALLLGQLLVDHFAANVRRGNAIDGDAVGRQFARQRKGEGAQCPLGG